jgi:methionyl-tRNA synthetase
MRDRTLATLHRWLRHTNGGSADGHDTRFPTGTDEHGQKTERAVAACRLLSQGFADRVSR